MRTTSNGPATLLSSLRLSVHCVHEVPIIDLHGLVDRPDPLIGALLVISFGRGAGGSDLRDEVPYAAPLLLARLAGRRPECLP